MRIRTILPAVLAGGLCLLATTSSALARPGVDVDLGLSVPMGDSGRLWLDIASRHYDYQPAAVQQWSVRYSNPDDLAVALFLSKTSGRDPEVIFSLRSQRYSWWEVGARVGVPVDAWYVPVERDPGPPYGKAYGYWKKHRSDPHYRVVLTDRQARDLVAVRMAHGYYGVPAETAMEWRRENRNVRDMMVVEYEKRHGHGGGSKGHGGGDDHGNKDKGHGKGHGNGNGHGK